MRLSRLWRDSFHNYIALHNQLLDRNIIELNKLIIIYYYIIYTFARDRNNLLWNIILCYLLFDYYVIQTAGVCDPHRFIVLWYLENCMCVTPMRETMKGNTDLYRCTYIRFIDDIGVRIIFSSCIIYAYRLIW